MERFSPESLSQYSHWRASAYVGGPNLLTSGFWLAFGDTTRLPIAYGEIVLQEEQFC